MGVQKLSVYQENIGSNHVILAPFCKISAKYLGGGTKPDSHPSLQILGGGVGTGYLIFRSRSGVRVKGPGHLVEKTLFFWNLFGH